MNTTLVNIYFRCDICKDTHVEVELCEECSDASKDICEKCARRTFDEHFDNHKSLDVV